MAHSKNLKCKCGLTFGHTAGRRHHVLDKQELCYDCFVNACRFVVVTDEEMEKSLMQSMFNRNDEEDIKPEIAMLDPLYQAAILNAATVDPTSPRESLRRKQ